MEKYKHDYQGSRRSRIEELEDNLRGYRGREELGSQQRLRSLEKQNTLKYNRSDLNNYSRGKNDGKKNSHSYLPKYGSQLVLDRNYELEENRSKFGSSTHPIE
jgi:hypothetical protein